MNVVTQLFQKIDSVSINAIQTIYSALVSALMPVFSVGVTIYVVYWGYEMIYGRAPLTAGSFVWRMLRIWLIYLIAFNWSAFSTLVVNVFTNTADGVATAVCTGVGGTSCGTPETAVASQLSNVLTNGLTAAKTIAASGGWGAALTLGLLAVVDIIATIIFVAAAITLVMIGKVALFVLLGLAPLFIAMALFDFSSTLFTGWLRTCAQYAIVPMLVYGILSFLLTIMNAAITNVGGITDISSGLTVLVPFLILCVVGTVILFQAMPIAASIAAVPRSIIHSPEWSRTLPATIGCAGFSLQAGQAAAHASRAFFRRRRHGDDHGGPQYDLARLGFRLCQFLLCVTSRRAGGGSPPSPRATPSIAREMALTIRRRKPDPWPISRKRPKRAPW